ncbi:hypothetical protein [uncultured Shewanella sp.]|uniref:hypothetical protein n=1 Tax=uncultured Shewanella sp. TaxID=173975 RepID=UPI002608F5BB|nr:hypothetical protein [uncultured Shewanella sp.]
MLRSRIDLLLMLVAIPICWLNLIHEIWIYMASLTALGFLIYGPVMLISLYALDLVPKKAAGMAAGFTGLWLCCRNRSRQCDYEHRH